MRIVCDFATVEKEANNIVNAADAMDNALKDYNSNVEKDLTGWDDKTSAKKAFQSTNTEQITNTNEHVTSVREVGEFVKESSNKIKSLEGQLAGLKI